MQNTRYLYASVMVGVLLLSGSITAQDNAAEAAPKAAKASSSEAAKASPGPTKASVDTLVVTARLIEIPGKFAPNDLYNYVYIMKYRVIKVLKGSYANKEILVGHYNPLIPRKQIKDKMMSVVKGNVSTFEVNAKHTLVLVKPIERIWKDAVEDDYSDSDMDKYFALKADVAP